MSKILYTVTDLANPPRYSPFNSDNWVTQNGGTPCIALFLESGSHEVEFWDRANCRHTKFKINIIPNPPTFIGPPTVVDLEFCDMDGNTGKWVEPCNYFGTLPDKFMYTSTKLNSSEVTFNSDDWVDQNGGNGCIALNMTPGSHQVDFFDKTNCTFKTFIFNITEIGFLEDICEKKIDIGCQDAINLDDIQYSCCPIPPGAEVRNWITIPHSQLSGSSFEATREILNWATCSRCITKLIVKRIFSETSVNLELTAHCPNTTLVDIKSLMPCANQFPANYKIFHYRAGETNMEQLNGDFAALCCDDPDLRDHVFEVTLLNGCVCRINLHITCRHELKSPLAPRTKVTGNSTTSNGSVVTRQGNIDSSSNMRIFPNPSTGKFNMIYSTSEMEGSGIYQISVIDITGKIVYTQSNLKVNITETFDLTGLPSGVYIVKVMMNGSTRFIKLIKS